MHGLEGKIVKISVLTFRDETGFALPAVASCQRKQLADRYSPGSRTDKTRDEATANYILTFSPSSCKCQCQGDCAVQSIRPVDATQPGSRIGDLRRSTAKHPPKSIQLPDDDVNVQQESFSLLQNTYQYASN